eukprot:TRINITY_DN2297_c0_g3_i2.p1 TRINITY_DN2297_c0_g3~~TRINITY_DN2297_c0_g3_i2.p1  ORF type:complete len:939 (+),score=239.22 TRINITY_DN2297_c0_g3_i2:37-2853(+)
MGGKDGGKGKGGKGAKGGKGKGKNQAIEPCVSTVTIKRASGSTPLGVVFVGCEITKVRLGTPGSLAGLVPSMKVLEVNGKPVTSPGEMKSAAADEIAFTMKVAINSFTTRQKGTVNSWKKEKGFGFISPAVPVFFPATDSIPQNISIADVFCLSSGIVGESSLLVGQPVEFMLRLEGGRAKAFDVTGPGRETPLMYKPEEDTKTPVAADIDSIVKGKDSFDEGRSICLLYAAGRCPFDDPQGTACPKGLHVRKKMATQAVCKIPDAPAECFTVRPISYGGKGDKKLTFDISEEGRAFYTLSATKTYYFKHLTYDGADTVRFTDLNTWIKLSRESIIRTLTGLKAIANKANVTHDIPDKLQEVEETLDRIMLPVSKAKLNLLMSQFKEASSNTLTVHKAWQLKNESLDFRFRSTEYNMTQQNGKTPDMIDGYHGTAESSVLGIALHGFDPLRRSGQVFGEGEYFAKDPRVSVGYCRGGNYMFLCKLILGEEQDHTWVPHQQYYIMKQREGNIQAIPMFLIKFTKHVSLLDCHLSSYAEDAKEAEKETLRRLGEKQRGGVHPCRGRTDGAMMAAKTDRLWVGWLHPTLASDEDELEENVKQFLEGYQVSMVKSQRNGARVGAFVELEHPITQLQVAELNTRPYMEQYSISVDDAQLNNPYTNNKHCPKLSGPGSFCRGWNLRGHHDWTEGCTFKHDIERFVNHGASVAYERIPRGAKYDELSSSIPGKVIDIQRIVHPKQEKAYESRRAFLNEKHGYVIEKELWHGTACSVLDTIIKNGLQCPSDCVPGKDCPVSGGKGLSTTLCGTDCKHCTERHDWKRCHMFGLGIYLADDPSKSHRYVTPHKGVHSLVRCRVNLGNPYLIEANLLEGDGLHNIVNCVDPTNYLSATGEGWDTQKGHDSYFVKGLKHKAKVGFGVINSEYIIFQPYQVLPLYIVNYTV